jgi:molybdate transport system ATP-binding protein
VSLAVDIRHRRGDFALEAAFAVDEPGVTALFGPSGAGKSTLVQAIAGLLRPDAGRITLDGATVVDVAAGRFVPARHRGIGCVFQDGRLFPHLSVRDNLLFGARRAGGRRGSVGFDDVVALLALGPLLGRRPRRLSGGERQRVALGRALLTAPRLLLLDEPLSALDAELKGEILPFLAAVRDEARVPMVYVSHALDEVTRLADTLVLLERGRVRAAGPIEDVLTRLELVDATGPRGAGAVIETVVAAHDDDDQLSELAFAGGTLVVPRLDAAPGTVVRVRIPATDVAVARGPVGATSINNVLAAKIAAIRERADTHADLRLEVGGTSLLARITRRSLRRLALVEGEAVAALIKSAAVIERAPHARLRRGPA